MKSVCLTVLETTKLFCKVVVPFCTPSSMRVPTAPYTPYTPQYLYGQFYFSFSFSHSDRYVIVSHTNSCASHFPNN